MCCRIKVVIHVSHNPTHRYDHMINEYYRSEKFRGKVYRISFLTLMKNNLIISYTACSCYTLKFIN